MSLTHEVRKEIERFLREGRKLSAIRHLKDSYGFSLQESKTLVEAIEENPDDAPARFAQPPATAAADEVLKAELRALLKSGRKIEAIKVAKETLGVGLRGAKVWVEELEAELNPLQRLQPRGVMTGGIVLGIMIGVGLLCLGGAFYIYLQQSSSIEHSDLIRGKVVSMQRNNDGMSAPVIEYEWHGKKWVYTSTTWSSPPAFEVDEEVPVYVNRQDPDDITVNTFSERWLVIMILGVLGFFFAGIPVAIMYFSTRR